MCCSGFLKIMMFVFNGAIFLAGAAILGVGVWVEVDSGSLLGLLETVEDAPDELSQLANVSYLLMGAGAVLLVIGFLGCCGAVRESRCMLMMFFIIVLIIFLVEVAGAIVLFVFQGLTDQLLMDVEIQVIKEIRVKYGEDEKMTSRWNATMKEFKCCGYKNYTDFDGSPFLDQYKSYPDTCCFQNVTTCTENNAGASNIGGCFQKFMDLIEENTVIIAAVALGIAAVEIAAMVVSLILYTKAGKKD
ncbi:tetraspanin 34a [Austrofundulus limnaeus]|uniref:Tetraspanin n=1 Tax=Austrofundulus limnaeus TaxID=52670 RepID=A0A2I4AY04_AUSLI|nr:PREDICTED: tetraspanin-1-like [Austrofundulus limnaeus]